MTVVGRSFGRPLPLHQIMRRGEEFFDAVLSTDIDEVLNRSKRVSRIAFTAAALAGEKLQLEGDGDSKRLIFAAYLNLGDLAHAVADEIGSEKAGNILTSSRTHQTLLLASSALNSIGFDRAVTDFRKQGAYFSIEDDGLAIDLQMIPKKYRGKGCPYAKGNNNKADYFTACSDHVINTYAKAWETSMPHSLLGGFVRRSK